MKIRVLGSGSGGNAAVVSSGGTSVLVDAGFRVKDTAQRCRRAGVEPESLSAVFVTHEHSDHRLGALDFSEKFGVPVYCSRGTAAALELDGSLFGHYVRVEAGVERRLGDLGFRAFATPHDANESLVFRFEDARASCVLASDLGHCGADLVDFLRGAAALFFEFNHDEELLRDGPYPWPLKKRISGGFGHLSNRQSAEAIAAAAGPALKCVVALHLSRQNNDPALVRAVLAETLERAGSGASYGCADQDGGYETIQI
jgi:phosphoribosyl 1,2-cyclic phosphodiesterase